LTPDLPLRRYRVLDFCWQAAGPLVTEILANLGAEVIRVESTTRIDQVRLYHHPLERFSIDTGAFFQDCNTGKKSISLDMSKAKARELVYRLVPHFDVVTDNFSPGQMEKWGLGYEQLRQLRPDIIVASFPVMGSVGPHRHWRAVGNGVVALCGLAGHTGFADRPPVGLGTVHTDFTLAPLAAASIMAALLQREQTGQGQRIEIAQYEAGIHLLDTELLEYLTDGQEAPRRGNRSPYLVPHGVFPCAGDDRWVAIAVRNVLEWQALCLLMGRPDLAARPDLQDVEGRRDHEDEIEAIVAAWTATQDAWQVTELLQSAGIPASPVEHIGDLVDGEPAIQDFLVSFVHPTGVEFIVQNQPFTWHGQRLPVSRAPLLGEHTEQVLRHFLGLGEEEIQALVIEGVIA
jgi:benzylsuccinate CoA-transferase BbsF subunit